MTPHLIAIAGGSASGKSWLTQRLLQDFAGTACQLSLDSFYRDLSHLALEERSRINFDHPDAIDWPLLYRCLSSIQQGETAHLPVYNFATHSRSPKTKKCQPRHLMVIEGLWLLDRPELRDLFSLSVYVDCPKEVRLARRLQRDQRERGRSLRSIHEQFETQVAPMHERFVAPQRDAADLVLNSPVSTLDISLISTQCLKLLWREDKR
jgi:uridine kinase